MSKVILKGFILVPQDELAAVRQALVCHTELTLEEPGCLVFEVTANRENPCRFHVYEEFKDKDAFLQHQARVQASDWGKLTVNVERHYEVFK